LSSSSARTRTAFALWTRCWSSSISGPGSRPEVVQLGRGAAKVGPRFCDLLRARASQEVAKLRLRRAGRSLAALDVGAELGLVEPHEDLPDLHQVALIDQDGHDPSGDLAADLDHPLGFDCPHALDSGHDVATRDRGHADGGRPEDEDGEAARNSEQDRDEREPRVRWPERAPVHAEVHGHRGRVADFPYVDRGSRRS
jgi:hypothetical protein